MLKKQGKIIANGVILEKHENATVVFLTSKGFDVELIPPVPQRKNPDIKIGRLFGEIKQPIANSKYTLPHAFKSALKQSPNIIFDLRNRRLHQEQAFNRLKHEFDLSKGVKRIKVILKSQRIIDFAK